MLVVVSIYVHRERVGGARPDSADPAPAETTQPALAPQSATHPRDLEQEMIEHENQTHAVQQAQSLQQVEGHEAAHVEHVERGGEVQEDDDRGARLHYISKYDESKRG
jgi:hypothetical protein